VVRIFRLYHRRLWGIVGFLIVLGLGLSQTQASAVVSADMTPVDFLQDWLGQLQKYGLLYRSNLIALLINLGYAAIATFLFRLSLRLMRRYYPRLYRKIYRLQRRWFPSIRIQDLELINAQSMVKGLIFIARGLRFFLLALLIYLYIPFLLNLSPWTQQFGEVLFTALLSGISSIALGILGYIPNLITVLLIVTVAYYLIRFSLKIFDEVGKGRLTIPGFYPVWANPTAKLFSFIIVAFAAVLAFPYLPGGSSPALQGVSLFAGVLLSLGSTAVISNLISGIVLIYTRAFTKGDRVTIGGITGDVVEEALLVTRIRTTKNKVVTIPNGMVLGGYIVNFSGSSKNKSDPPLNRTPWRHR
jgi:small-conductance mechanosensitive channel